MSYRPNTSDAECRIREAANDARLAALDAEERRLKLEKARDVVEDMRRLKADETTIAAFVATVLTETKEVHDVTR